MSVMKAVLPIIFLFISTFVIGQACIPDTLYRDSTAGIYPRPKSDLNPNGGIDTFACIGQPFDFVFTVIIPDTFSFNGILLTLLSAEIETEGAVMGLPSGIDYACNPPDCIFPADSIGCIVLQGIPDLSNQPGNYEPVVEMTINTSIFPISVTFPGPIFPGSYDIELRDENCLPVNTFSYEPPEFWQAYPNPVFDEWRFSYHSEELCEHILTISDLTGKVLIQRKWTSSGYQERNIELGHLQGGLYIYNLIAGDRSVTGRIMVGK